MNLAAQEFGLGDAGTALEHSARALPVLRAWRHPDLAECLSNEATFLTALDRYDEARERALESLNVALQTVADAPARAIHAVQRLAAVAALLPSDDPGDEREDRMNAAQLLGYADARLSATRTFRWPTDQRDVDRAMTSLTHALGESQVAELRSRGAALSDDQAVELALDLAV
jgi:tetratricopeptide (TPR) repeat protein